MPQRAIVERALPSAIPAIAGSSAVTAAEIGATMLIRPWPIAAKKPT